MARIAGVDLPANKRIDIALTYVYGIGRVTAADILEKAKLDRAKRTKDLTEQELRSLQQAVEKHAIVEGRLRQSVQENVKRLRQIGSYRGLRHSRSLPVRGQRTRSNARTKRGKRQTIGAMRKEMRAKMDQPAATK